MAITNKRHSDWIALLEAASARKIQGPPKGFFPSEHWLKHFRISETTWRRTVPVFEEQGVFEKGYFDSISNGRTIKKPFWKKKK